MLLTKFPSTLIYFILVLLVVINNNGAIEASSNNYFFNKKEGVEFTKNTFTDSTKRAFDEPTRGFTSKTKKPKKKGKRLALVIGNSKYTHIDSLPNPVNDADSMERTLDDLGFEVLAFKDLEYREMNDAINSFAKKLQSKKYEAALFFYAGHGLQVKGENYLVPIEANISTESNVSYKCVPAMLLLNLMGEAETAINIVILDACRNNPFEEKFARSAGRTRRLGGIKAGGLAPMDAPQGTIIAYSTAPGKVALDGEGKNGLYTSALLEQIKNVNVTIEEMFKSVREDVIELSKEKQISWESTSLTGQFYFNPQPNLLVNPPLPPPIPPKPDLPPENMSFIKGDVFKIGCTSTTNNCEENAISDKEINLDDFYMDQYEVTNQQFCNFLNTTSITADELDKMIKIENPKCNILKVGGEFVPKEDGARKPVVMVTWNGANAYAESVGKKLPTEAQWEYAAKCGSKQLPWGGTSKEIELFKHANYKINKSKEIKPVGNSQPNEFGLYDMSGNVWEWCGDWYTANSYENMSTNNPAGPDKKDAYKVIRGGSYASDAKKCRTTKRYNQKFFEARPDTGFRCVMEIKK